jgi:hypothetical protein
VIVLDTPEISVGRYELKGEGIRKLRLHGRKIDRGVLVRLGTVGHLGQDGSVSKFLGKRILNAVLLPMPPSLGGRTEKYGHSPTGIACP